MALTFIYKNLKYPENIIEQILDPEKTRGYDADTKIVFLLNDKEDDPLEQIMDINQRCLRKNLRMIVGVEWSDLGDILQKYSSRA